MFLMLALFLCIMAATALYCAIRLTRPIRQPLAIADVSPMKAALERRVREGTDFTF